MVGLWHKGWRIFSEGLSIFSLKGWFGRSSFGQGQFQESVNFDGEGSFLVARILGWNWERCHQKGIGSDRPRQVPRVQIVICQFYGKLRWGYKRAHHEGALEDPYFRLWNCCPIFVNGSCRYCLQMNQRPPRLVSFSIKGGGGFSMTKMGPSPFLDGFEGNARPPRNRDFHFRHQPSSGPPFVYRVKGGCLTSKEATCVLVGERSSILKRALPPNMVFQPEIRLPKRVCASNQNHVCWVLIHPSDSISLCR